MWRLYRLGFRHEPWLLASSFVLALVAAVPDALLAVWLSLLGRAVLNHDRVLLLIAAFGLGLSATGTWLLSTVSTRVQRRFRDKVTIVLEGHIARLQASIPTIAHQERPDYLDRLAVLRDQVFVLDHMYMSVFGTAGWVLRLAVTLGLLMSIHPALGLLLFFALPTVLSSAWRPGVERAVQERVAPFSRLARHFFTIATTAGPGKEIRVWGIGPRVARERRQAWEQWYGTMSRTRLASAAWNAIAWSIFGAGYVGAIAFVALGIHASAGAVLLVLAAGSRLSTYVAATVGEIGFLRGIWLDGSRRLAWLEDYAAYTRSEADQPVPKSIGTGIRLDGVCFSYPGTARRVLEDVDLQLPGGSVVAIVGENGAGKSTLVKLLAKFYDPTEGQILVDGVDLRRIPAEDWRRHLAGGFQDFFRFELQARQSVGVGDVRRIEDEPAVLRAVSRAGAEDLVAGFERGLATQLGPTWPGGVEVSFGQWQKLALARGFMREEPLLLILDEPTAALDAETEHALFERYASAAHADGVPDRRGITILVSHRFSTVRMADLIVVLSGARVVEVGAHEELMALGGHYAELYGIQAAAYR